MPWEPLVGSKQQVTWSNLTFLKGPSGYDIDQKMAEVQAERPGRRKRGWGFRKKGVEKRLLD